jgi:hypothetical protein
LHQLDPKPFRSLRPYLLFQSHQDASAASQGWCRAGSSPTLHRESVAEETVSIPQHRHLDSYGHKTSIEAVSTVVSWASSQNLRCPMALCARVDGQPSSSGKLNRVRAGCVGVFRTGIAVFRSRWRMVPAGGKCHVRWTACYCTMSLLVMAS